MAQDDDDDRRDDDDAPRSRSDKAKPPGKVTGMGVMCLVGGIIAVIEPLVWAGSTIGFCWLWPGVYYSLVLGIMAIIRGAGLLGASAHQQTPPTGIGIMMIINIINLDIINCVLGILVLVFSADDEVKDYLKKA
jgi:hypothetical protein